MLARGMQETAVPIVDDLAAAARLADGRGATEVALFASDLRDWASRAKYADCQCVAVRPVRSTRRPSWLMAANRMMRVTRLAIVGLEVSPAGASALARGLPNLRDLEIAMTTLGDEGLASLVAGLPHPEQLARLSLTRTGTSAAAIIAASEQLRELDYIDLRSEPIGAEDAATITVGFGGQVDVEISGL